MEIPPIAILTDFGIQDPYVGIMKGVISRIAPQAPLIDLTHQIPPGDIRQGAYYLWQAFSAFPPGTVFLAVVDPGVGTSRKGIYLEIGESFFIGPDNGLCSYLNFKHETSAWELSNPEYQLDAVSHTFHGRDIFAPAAAYAAMGVSGAAFGRELKKVTHLPAPLLDVKKDSIEGEIVSIDRFGNLVTSIGCLHNESAEILLDSWIKEDSTLLPPFNEISLDVGRDDLPLVNTFQEIDQGKCGALIGSTGLLEISSNQSSAAELTGLKKGDPVTLTWS